jgi:hypothetical protein
LTTAKAIHAASKALAEAGWLAMPALDSTVMGLLPA